METWDAIRARRNVRSYSDRPLAPEDLDRILEAGRRSPSSRNWQPWDLVVVTDRDQREAISKVWQFGAYVAGAQAVVALVGQEQSEEQQRLWQYFDHGQAMMAMMLAAADLGIGSGHSSVGEQDEARRILGVPADRVCAYMIALGHPAGRPLTPVKAPDRRPLSEVVHRGRW